MTSIEDVKQFQLEIAEMQRKLKGISDSLKAYNYELDDLLILHEIANSPNVGEVTVHINSISFKMDANVVADSLMNQMYDKFNTANPLLIRLQEAINGQG